MESFAPLIENLLDSGKLLPEANSRLVFASGSDEASANTKDSPLSMSQTTHAGSEQLMLAVPATALPGISGSPDISGSQDTSGSFNHKAIIKFEFPSCARRNIDKSLIRSVITLRKKVEMEILAEYTKQKIDPVRYHEVNALLGSMKLLEREDKTRKDYASIMNYMLGVKEYRIVVQQCLRYKKKTMEEPFAKRVPKRNRKVYLATLDDYLRYINSL